MPTLTTLTGAFVPGRHASPSRESAMLLGTAFLGTVFLGTVFLGTLSLGTVAWGGDWPQILGPHRDGSADGEQLADKWPATGPKQVWQRPVGSGMAGVAVADGRVVLFHRVADEEVLECLDADTGKPRWKAAFPTRYRSSVSDDNGPRCVPLIHDDAVYAFGAEGNLHAVSLADGRKLWSRAVYVEYDAPEGYFGAGSTPIVEGDKLLVNVGGKKGSGLVAFDLASGRTVWQTTDEQASYSSPTLATVGGRRQAIFVTRLNVVGIDPESGQVLWQFPFGARGPTVNAATPLVLGDHVFVSASYGVGAALARIGPMAVEPVWANDKAMSSQYSTCVVHDGTLYGIHGREDVGSASLRAVDPRTGDVLWSEDRFGTGAVILADDKLVIVQGLSTIVRRQSSGRAHAGASRVVRRPLVHPRRGQAGLFRPALKEPALH
jgi:outer membrane protein assembly factor BamB